MTGAYIRIKRADGWQAVEIEDMTEEEIFAAMKGREHDDLVRWIVLLAHFISAEVVESTGEEPVQ
jgi:hypothetical protein